MRAHAVLSASGASRWMECTPSARLEQEVESVSSTYADEGTHAHKLGELLIRYKLSWIRQKVFKEVLKELESNVYYSGEMYEYCEDYAVFVMEKFNEKPNGKIFLEQKLDMTDYIEDGFGTADVVIIHDRTITLIDLKYGKGVAVKAFDNKQLKLYGLGTLNAFDYIFDFDQIETYIFQPRLDSIEHAVYLKEDLVNWAETELRSKAKLAFAGEGEFKVGDWCRFCKVKATCKAFADQNLKLVQSQFEDEPVKDPVMLTDAEVTEILKGSKLFLSWLKAVGDYALKQALFHDKKWPGLKLVEGKSNRKYSDETNVSSVLLDKGFKPEEIYNKKLKGLGDLTKLVGKADFDKLLSGLIVKPPGKPALVGVEDKRAEITNLEMILKAFDDEEMEGDD